MQSGYGMKYISVWRLSEALPEVRSHKTVTLNAFINLKFMEKVKF